MTLLLISNSITEKSKSNFSRLVINSLLYTKLNALCNSLWGTSFLSRRRFNMYFNFDLFNLDVSVSCKNLVIEEKIWENFGLISITFR